MSTSYTTAAKARSFRTALITAGIPVPADLKVAIAATEWSYQPYDLDASINQALDTKNEKDFQRVVDDAAQGMLIDIAAKQGLIPAFMEAHRERRFEAAMDACSDELFSEIITRFNAEAPRFNETASQIPNLTDARPMDISPEVSTILATAKASAAVLKPLWNLYQGLGSITYRTNTCDQWNDRLNWVFQLGDPDSFEAASRCAHRIHETEWLGAQAEFHALNPFYCLNLDGIALDMCTPEEAEARWRFLTED